MPTKVIHVPLLDGRRFPVAVEVFGPLGVQQSIGEKPWNGEPYLICSSYCVVHIPTGHCITWTGSRKRARALASELSRIPGWEKIPAGFNANQPGASARCKALLGQAFIERVKATVKRHQEGWS